jgi:hypothetical protein
MIDRQQLESILSRRFPGAPLAQIAAAANAIMGLNRETPADRHDRSAGSACAMAGDGGGADVAPALPSKSA